MSHGADKNFSDFSSLGGPELIFFNERITHDLRTEEALDACAPQLMSADELGVKFPMRRVTSGRMLKRSRLVESLLVERSLVERMLVESGPVEGMATRSLLVESR